MHYSLNLLIFSFNLKKIENFKTLAPCASNCWRTWKKEICKLQFISTKMFTFWQWADHLPCSVSLSVQHLLWDLPKPPNTWKLTNCWIRQSNHVALHQGDLLKYSLLSLHNKNSAIQTKTANQRNTCFFLKIVFLQNSTQLLTANKDWSFFWSFAGNIHPIAYFSGINTSVNKKKYCVPSLLLQTYILNLILRIIPKNSMAGVASYYG